MTPGRDMAKYPVKKNDMVLSTGLHLIFGRTAQ